MLALNVNYYIEVLGKLSLFFVLAALGLKLEALLLASCGGMLLSLLHGWTVSARGLSLFTTSGEHIPSGLWKSLGQDFTDSLMTNLFILFCISIDMLYVQHYFPEHTSSYAIALKYSQLVYYVSYSLIAAFIPKIGAQGHDRQALGKLITVYAGLMAVAAICVYVGTTFVFPSSIPILFGASYQSAGGLYSMGRMGVLAIFHRAVFCACARIGGQTQIYVQSDGRSRGFISSLSYCPHRSGRFFAI